MCSYKNQNREDKTVGKSTVNGLGYKLSKPLPKLVFVLSSISKVTPDAINT